MKIQCYEVDQTYTHHGGTGNEAPYHETAKDADYQQKGKEGHERKVLG